MRDSEYRWGKWLLIGAELSLRVEGRKQAGRFVDSIAEE